MAKRKEQTPIAVLKEHADKLLMQIREEQSTIDQTLAECKSEMEKVVARYDEKAKPLLESRDLAIGVLIKLMRSNKNILFADTDVISLNSGRLLHSKEDKVTIPRDALEKCEEQGFADVIKIAKSLDREAIEKWTDEKLFLIGAIRKPKETFNYEVKK